MLNGARRLGQQLLASACVVHRRWLPTVQNQPAYNVLLPVPAALQWRAGDELGRKVACVGNRQSPAGQLGQVSPLAARRGAGYAEQTRVDSGSGRRNIPRQFRAPFR